MRARALLLLASLAQPCPPSGSGGDPALNRAKNRTEAPATYEPLALADLVALPPPPGASKRDRSRWPAAARAALAVEEARAVAVEGYVVAVRLSGPEACNCGAQSDRDVHVWLGAAGAAKPEAVVVEVTPHVQRLHPAWRLRNLRRLATQGARVRVSGWLLFDEEHPSEIGRSRATSWELHPVTRIEVWTAGAWREL